MTVLSTYIADSVAYYGDGVEPTINRFTGDNPKDPQLEVSREVRRGAQTILDNVRHPGVSCSKHR